MSAMNIGGVNPIDLCLRKISETKLTALDFLPHAALAEKLIELDLSGPPAGLTQQVAGELSRLRAVLSDVDTATGEW